MKLRADHNLRITPRAARDLKSIETYSIVNFGGLVALRYFERIQQSVLLIADNPGLLLRKLQFPASLRFYISGKHLLVFACIEHMIYLLTVQHTSLNLVERLAELEPALMGEAHALHAKLTVH